jgi:hypothetical protein
MRRGFGIGEFGNVYGSGVLFRVLGGDGCVRIEELVNLETEVKIPTLSQSARQGWGTLGFNSSAANCFGVSVLVRR